MLSSIILHILLLLFLMMCSAFFSGSETAFFSVNRMRLQRLSFEGNEKAGGIIKLLQKPRNLLLSILMGNELTNVSVSAVATALWIIIAGPDFGPFIAFITSLFLLVLFCEISPKSFAINHPEKFCNSVFAIMNLWYRMLYPFRFILIKFYELIFKLLKMESSGEDDHMTTDDFMHWLETSKEDRILDKDEYELIYQTLNLKNKKVKDVMTPRTDIFSIDFKNDLNNIIEKIKSPEYSRIPVYNENLDHIIGMLYTKDFLDVEMIVSHKELRSYLHKVEYVSGFMKLNELLVYFMRRKIHVAVVTDEYGGMDGLVSFEDILEELVGEIQDEFDREEPIIKTLGENKYRISALMGVSDFNEQFNTDFEKINYDTIGGLLLEQFGRIPSNGDEIRIANFSFKIMEVINNRIISIELTEYKGKS